MKPKSIQVKIPFELWIDMVKACERSGMKRPDFLQDAIVKNTKFILEGKLNG